MIAKRRIHSRHPPGANPTGARLLHAHLSGVDLSGVDLSGARLLRADLSDADLAGAWWGEATMWPSAARAERMRTASDRLPDGRWRVRLEGGSEDAQPLT
ncbi:pentapeptide repeat-containing protein [Nonomuraea sp. NPDC004297]